jgi:hypothetical protein
MAMQTLQMYQIVYGKQKMAPRCFEWHHRLKDTHESPEDHQNIESGLQVFILVIFLGSDAELLHDVHLNFQRKILLCMVYKLTKLHGNLKR